jgi:hypothetical protein
MNIGFKGDQTESRIFLLFYLIEAQAILIPQIKRSRDGARRFAGIQALSWESTLPTIKLQVWRACHGSDVGYYVKRSPPQAG